MNGVQVVVLAMTLAAGCAASTGQGSWANRRDADLRACHAATSNGMTCLAAGDWLAYERRTTEARAAHMHGCVLGHVPSCAREIARGNEDARLRACELGMYGDCVDWLARNPVDEPRRSAVVELVCTRSTTDCAEVLAAMLARHEPGGERWARQVCASPDLGSCRAVTRLEWPDAAFRIDLDRLACDAQLGESCWRLAEPTFAATDEARVAATRDLVRKACSLGFEPACDRERTLAERERDLEAWTAGCKRGEREACVRLGRATARTK
jgi:hypothetical protein